MHPAYLGYVLREMGLASLFLELCRRSLRIVSPYPLIIIHLLVHTRNRLREYVHCRPLDFKAVILSS